LADIWKLSESFRIEKSSTNNFEKKAAHVIANHAPPQMNEF